MNLPADSLPFVESPWRMVLPLALAALGVYFLLPRPRGRSLFLGAVSGIAALVLGGFLLLRIDGSFSVEAFMFYAFSAMAVLGGVSLISQSNPGRAAISFALVVMNVCGLFLLQAAPFLMAAAIIIYAGAIIVTFLFVLMLAQQTGFSDADDRSREPFIASFSAFVLLGAILVLLDYTFPDPQRFSAALARVAAATEKEAPSDIRAALGGRDQLLRLLRSEENRLRGSPHGNRWKDAVDDLQEQLTSERATATSLKDALTRVSEIGRMIQQENRYAALPAENVAALGRLLFSDYILAVELGGTLLLVATIGAIAITARRMEKAA